jgi:hypothetical protein
MKSNVSVNIDSELLDIIKDCSDSDLDSIIQDALAQFFGVKQVWVRSDTLDQISAIPVKIDEASTDETSTDETSTDETSTDETSTDETSIDETSIDETSIDETSIDETSIDETSIDETSIDETSITKNIPVVKKRRKPKFVLT